MKIDCKVLAISRDNDLTEYYQYRVGDQPLIIPFPTYFTSPPECYKPLTFATTTQQRVGTTLKSMQVPDFVKVNLNKRTFTVQSDDSKNAGKSLTFYLDAEEP